MSLLRHRMLMGSQFHPFYQAILARAVGAGYILPSYACMVLQDQLVRNLVQEGIWAQADYLHVYADDSGATDMARINWVQPLLGLSTGTPTHVSKKGLYGTINHSFTAPTNFIAMGVQSATAYANQFVYLTENGGTISTVEHLVGLNPENIGNGRQQTIRLRTTPRVDYLLNTTVAGSNIIYNAFPLDNHFYMTDIGNIGGVIHSTTWVNGVNFMDTFPVGVGLLPDAGTLKTQTINSSRAVGLIGGGLSVYALGKQVVLYNMVKAYMDAVQLL